MRTHPLATAATAIAASVALLAAAFTGSTGLLTVLAIAIVVPLSAVVAGRFLLGVAARPQRANPERSVSDPDVASVTTMLAGFMAAVLIVVAGGVVGLAMHGDLDHDSMMAGSSSDHMAFMLDTVPGDVAAHYELARANRDLYSHIPCYCGCEATLDHRYLFDCFVTPDGGWESHASGCSICIDESKMARRMMSGGAQPDAIRDAIVARYEALIPG
jgi:hypothetical protein